MLVMVTVAVVFALLVLMRLNAARIYDFLIIRMTSLWYKVVLDRIKPGETILDIGIGTATALLNNARVVREKNLNIVGVDYDKAYIEAAGKNVRKCRLESHIKVHCNSIYDPGLSAQLRDKDGEVLPAYDAAYFSGYKDGEVLPAYDAAHFRGSLTLMPEPSNALKVAQSLCKEGAPIYITQTFQLQHSPVTEVVKPLMRYLTTIDFGQLTYLSKVDDIIREAGMRIDENIAIPGSIQTSWQSARLIVVRPGPIQPAEAKK
ncbi:hypothetical protein AAMO2058_000198300 [Amorphochlora amoebiformis]